MWTFLKASKSNQATENRRKAEPVLVKAEIKQNWQATKNAELSKMIKQKLEEPTEVQVTWKNKKEQMQGKGRVTKNKGNRGRFFSLHWDVPFHVLFPSWGEEAWGGSLRSWKWGNKGGLLQMVTHIWFNVFYNCWADLRGGGVGLIFLNKSSKVQHETATI